MLDSYLGRTPALALLCALACNPIEADETSGELGNGAFRWICVGRDAICPSGGDAERFPEAVATDSRFDVSYRSFDDTSDAQVSSPSSLIQTTGTNFRALRAGVAALIARRTVDSANVDFTHLTLLDVAALEVRRDSGASVALVMDVGSVQSLVAEPVDDTGTVLAGAIDVEWTSSDPSVLALELASGSARMNVRAASAGTATLGVEHGAVSQSFEIEVIP